MLSEVAELALPPDVGWVDERIGGALVEAGPLVDAKG
jgi:hypothetical protein